MLGLYYHRLVVRVTFSENRSWFPQSISFCLFSSNAAGDVNCLKCGNLCWMGNRRRKEEVNSPNPLLWSDMESINRIWCIKVTDLSCSLQYLLPNPVQTPFHGMPSGSNNSLPLHPSFHLLMTVAAIIRPVVSRVTVMRKGSERGRKREKQLFPPSFLLLPFLPPRAAVVLCENQVEQKRLRQWNHLFSPFLSEIQGFAKGIPAKFWL